MTSKEICKGCGLDGQCPNQTEAGLREPCANAEAVLEEMLGLGKKKTPEKKLVTLKAGGQSYEFSRQADQDQFQKDTLESLNENFRAAAIEKYDEAITNLLMTEGLKKYGRGKAHISDHQYDRIQKHMIRRMRGMYGPNINVFRRKDRFLFNHQFCYKTEQGRLYNAIGIMNLFVTSHAIDRFEERTAALEKTTWMVRQKMHYREKWNTTPTVWDLMEDCLMRVYQFARIENTVFLNLTFGVLAVDILTKNYVCIGKTFLTPSMAPKSGWLELPEEYMVVITDDMHKNATPCVPTFFSMEADDAGSKSSR
jgi:hypothetical protein